MALRKVTIPIKLCAHVNAYFGTCDSSGMSHIYPHCVALRQVTATRAWVARCIDAILLRMHVRLVSRQRCARGLRGQDYRSKKNREHVPDKTTAKNLSGDALSNIGTPFFFCFWSYSWFYQKAFFGGRHRTYGRTDGHEIFQTPKWGSSACQTRKPSSNLIKLRYITFLVFAK